MKAQKHDIKLIFGRPYNPKGRGKIERYHKTLYREPLPSKNFVRLFTSSENSGIPIILQQFEKTGNPQLDDSTISVRQQKQFSTKIEKYLSSGQNSVNKTDINCGTLKVLKEYAPENYVEMAL